MVVIKNKLDNISENLKVGYRWKWKNWNVIKKHLLNGKILYIKKNGINFSVT